MSTDHSQKPQPQPPAPRSQPQDSFAKRGTLAAIGGFCSGIARAVMASVLRDGA
ncbi:hypothetical protein [Streptomyces sp. NPDC008121]|uniref:hypothetical protein n=1 Tax=Streptomyces sp. NPDC008121 TaxID=3364809 RepID=UPI0036EC8264